MYVEKNRNKNNKKNKQKQIRNSRLDNSNTERILKVKKNFDEKYTICQLIWVAQVVFYHLDYPQSHPERPACLYINSYDHFIVVATSFRLRFLTSTARMRRAAKFFIWLC